MDADELCSHLCDLGVLGSEAAEFRSTNNEDQFNLEIRNSGRGAFFAVPDFLSSRFGLMKLARPVSASFHWINLIWPITARSWQHAGKRLLAQTSLVWIISTMSAQEMLLEEIRRQPEPVLREVLHYLKFLVRRREEEAWADVRPDREVEQEVLDLMDGQ